MRSVMRRANLGSACLLLFAGAPVALAQAAPEKIFLFRTVPSDLHAKSRTSANVAALVSNSIPRAVAVKPGDSVSTLLHRELNISQAWTPALYQATANQVLALNSLGKPEDLQVGMVRIPDLPRTAKRDQAKGNPNYGLPQISTPFRALGQGAAPVARTSMSWNRRLDALVGQPVLDNVSRLASRLELQVRELPLNEALKVAVLVDDEDSAAGEGRYVAANQGITISMGQTTGMAAAAKSFAGDDEKKFREFMAQSPKSRPLVVILDDSWPDNGEYKKSIRFIAAASRLIRSHFRMESRTADSDELKTVLDVSDETRFPVAPYPELKQHASQIKASLKEFVAADPRNAVEVIYIPATKVQPGAFHALKEIMYIAAYARFVGEGLREKRTPVNEAKIKSDASKFAQEIASSASISVTLPDIKKPAYTISSDKAVVESIAFFLSLYSEAAQRPHFLSMSWKVADLKFQAWFREFSYGLMVSAAGNDKGASISAQSSRVQFAARSVRPGDVLAVSNSDGAKLICDSNVLPLLDGIPVFGLAFDGRVETGVCGTSFSAPRVAWLLAAREAILGAPPKDIDEMGLWPAVLKARLLRLQNSAIKNQDRYHVSAATILGLNE